MDVDSVICSHVNICLSSAHTWSSIPSSAHTWLSHGSSAHTWATSTPSSAHTWASLQSPAHMWTSHGSSAQTPGSLYFHGFSSLPQSCFLQVPCPALLLWNAAGCPRVCCKITASISSGFRCTCFFLGAVKQLCLQLEICWPLSPWRELAQTADSKHLATSRLKD